jgi:peptidoglycan hydrolase CwlO-like protein
MKLRSATPAIRRMTTRATLIGFAIVFSFGVSVQMIHQVAADKWDDQIASLRSQANQYQAQADQLRAQGDTLQNKLDQINAQIAALQANINANQAKHDKLQADIAANQQKLKDTQDALGDMLANLYVDDNVSSIELLASSSNISDFVDKQEYRSSVRDQLNSSIAEVKKIKAQLESDQKAVDKVLAVLKIQNDQLAAQQADQQQLVDQTRGDEAAYQQLVNSARSQMQSIQAQQQAYYASLLSRGGGNSGVVGSFQYWGWSGNQGCGGGYPYCMGQDSIVDPWNLYNRECVSYVAWALENRFGKSVGAFHGDGNAYQWPSSAPRWSGAYRTYDPQPGDAVILPANGGFAPIGHAMIVESVSGDSVFVSQYNMYGTGQYSTMWIKNSGVIFLRFPSA